MKTLVWAVLLASVAVALGSWDVSGYGPEENLAHRQQDVNRLLYRINEEIPDEFTHLKELAHNFDPLADLDLYTDHGEAAKKLMSMVKDHIVTEKKHWFSLFNKRQREEALMLFDVLIHCHCWHGFVANAAYFREKMNEGQFVYAVYVAVIHSELGQGIILPPLYEVTPHMFTNTEVIQKAYTAQMTRTPGKFSMSFTGSKKNKEQRVAYFGEDIGLNTHHVTWHMDYPFWWKDSYGYHLDRKGEIFFWAHHQLTVRFDVERLSNNLNFVDELYWNKPIKEGFAPHTTYKYGGQFPARPDNIHFEDVDGVAKIRDMTIMENRIRDAIAHGYVTDKYGHIIDIRNDHGIDVVGDIIESSTYSPNIKYYGSLHNLAHIVLGSQADPHEKYNMPPGVMQHFETATRDPAFFRLHKYMDNIFKEHKYTLPPYTAEDIQFHGIEVVDVSVSGELETFFEDFEFDLDMAVDHIKGKESVILTAAVPRLNHEPFSYNIEINNNNNEERFGTIRIFLCPKKDGNGAPLSPSDLTWHCLELDKFWKTLKPGGNHVVRHSIESSLTVPDIPGFHKLIKKTDAAVKANKELHLSEFSRSCGIPNRLLLPKGKKLGLEMKLLVAVTDGHTDAVLADLEHDEHGGTHILCGVHGEKYPDRKPLGYPFDRRIDDVRIFKNAPNIHKTYVKVFHKDEHCPDV